MKKLAKDLTFEKMAVDDHHLDVKCHPNPLSVKKNPISKQRDTHKKPNENKELLGEIKTFNIKNYAVCDRSRERYKATPLNTVLSDFSKSS